MQLGQAEGLALKGSHLASVEQND